MRVWGRHARSIMPPSYYRRTCGFYYRNAAEWAIASREHLRARLGVSLRLFDVLLARASTASKAHARMLSSDGYIARMLGVDRRSAPAILLDAKRVQLHVTRALKPKEIT